MTNKKTGFADLGKTITQELGAELKTSILDKPRRDWDLIQVPLEAIIANPNQPRKEFNEVSIRELADSIEENGLLQPLVARPLKDSKLQLIAGERRLRALKMLGRATAPVIVRDTEDPSELSLIENIQREDLNPVDLAEALRQLKMMREMTDEELGRILGKSRTWVTESMSIADLSSEIRQKAKELNISRSLLIEAARDKSKLEVILKGEAKTVKSLREQGKGSDTTRKRFAFSYKPVTGQFAVTVSVIFKKSKATKEEVKTAVKEATASLIKDLSKSKAN